MLLRVLALLMRTGMVLCVTLLVLAALYVSLGRELVPLVAEYRLEVENKAQELLKTPVHIGSLEGSWYGFSPRINANHVQIGEGEERLQLGHVRVVPDVFASLLAFKPQIARIELEGLNLVVAQAEDGRWSLQGLPQRKEPLQLNLPEAFRQAQMVKRVALINSQVSVLAHDQAPLTLTYANLTLRNGLSRQQLDGRVMLPDGQPLGFKLETALKPERWQDSKADLYLSIPQSNWADWLPDNLLGKWKLEQLQFGGDVWLAANKGAVTCAAARLHGQSVKASYDGRVPAVLDDLSINAYFKETKQGHQLVLNNVAFSLGEVRWGEVSASLIQQRASDTEDESWSIGISRVDLAPLQPVIQALAPLPEQVMERLGQMAPRGELHNINLTLRPGGKGVERLAFAANLKSIGFSASQGVPAAENVSGSVQGNLGQGELRVDSTDFALHLNTLFPKPWRYQTAKGLLAWSLDDEAFTLRAPYVQVVGEEGPAAADFLIRLHRDHSQENYMDLRVGMRNGDARFAEKYLPSLSPAMSQPLDQWLKTAIRGGKVDEGIFQFQGALNKGAAPESRSINLFFAVRDAELAFQPNWPSLQQGVGTVLVEDTGVRVDLVSGRLLNSQVGTSQARVPAVKPGEVPHLLLDGQVSSSVQDALQILQEAPIGTSSIFAGWSGEGPLEGRLNLDIPLRKGVVPVVVVDFATEGALLSISTPSLQFSQLKGEFRYDTRLGLSAPDIRAQVLGHSVRGKAVAEGRRGKARSRIEAQGQMAVAELTRWLGVTQPLPVQGRVPYFLNLTLDGPDSQLRVSSGLKGVSINLPAPFGKATAEERTAEWRMTLSGDERRYWLDYAGLASLSFAASPGKFDQGRGELRLADGPARLPVSRGFQVRGRLAELDWSAWQNALKPYTQNSGGVSLQMFKDANVRIARFNGFGVSLSDLDVLLARSQSNWQVELNSRQLRGRVGVPDSKAVPIAINLDYLRLPARKSKSESDSDADTSDPLAAIDPRTFPALNVKADAVYLGQEALGSWVLNARPIINGVRFSDLDLNLMGLKVAGEATWEQGPQGLRTLYKGRLSGGDLAQILSNWGFAPSASSRSFRLDVEGNWPGSPAWFSLKRFSGSLDASLRKGQFSEVDGTASALRVFGLLNFNSIGRRLRLDFSDLLDKGLSYDRFKGVLAASNGVYVTRTPITLEGPSSNLELDGTLDMARDRIDAKLLVTLPVSNNLPLAALIVGAPAIGGALFVVDKLLGDQVARFASVQYDVKGSWQNPQISFDKPFEKPH